MRASPEDGEIMQIDVEMNGNYLVFHVVTDCASAPCDWGKQWVCVSEDPMKATYYLVFKETTLVFHRLADGQLRVTVTDHFKNAPVMGLAQTTEYTFDY